MRLCLGWLAPPALRDAEWERRLAAPLCVCCAWLERGEMEMPHTAPTADRWVSARATVHGRGGALTPAVLLQFRVFRPSQRLDGTTYRAHGPRPHGALSPMF